MSEQNKKTLQESLEEFVMNNFPLFKEIYNSEKEMLDYCLKFQQIYKPPERAFEEFLRLSEYHRAMKLMKTDFIKLIMTISLIEKLNSKEDFIEFAEWLSKERKTKMTRDERAEKAWNDYNKEFGCSSKFRRFFQNQKYLSKNEQLVLLKSVCYFVENEGNSLSLVPLFCHDEAICGKRDRGCTSVTDGDCPALEKEEILKEGIKEFSNFLYHLRNKFVHDAHMFRLSKVSLGSNVPLIDYVPYKFQYIKRPLYNGQVVLVFSQDELEKMLDRNWKKLLDDHITLRSQLTASSSQ